MMYEQRIMHREIEWSGMLSEHLSKEGMHTKHNMYMHTDCILTAIPADLGTLNLGLMAKG